MTWVQIEAARLVKRIRVLNRKRLANTSLPAFSREQRIRKVERDTAFQIEIEAAMRRIVELGGKPRAGQPSIGIVINRGRM